MFETLLHYLGVCPCRHGHADVTDLLVLISMVPFIGTWISLKLKKNKPPHL